MNTKHILDNSSDRVVTDDSMVRFEDLIGIMLDIDIKTGNYNLHAENIESIALRFWNQVNDICNLKRWPNLFFYKIKDEKIEPKLTIDPKNCQIIHKFWNPETAFMLTTLEKNCPFKKPDDPDDGWCQV